MRISEEHVTNRGVTWHTALLFFWKEKKRDSGFFPVATEEEENYAIQLTDLSNSQEKKRG